MRSKYELREAKKLLKKKKGKLLKIDLSKINHPQWMTRCYKNNHYCVMINDKVKMSDGSTAIRSMIQRHDDKPIKNHWREIQDVKNEIFGNETTGIEYYPAESELCDKANIYWLWILDSIPIQEIKEGEINDRRIY